MKYNSTLLIQKLGNIYWVSILCQIFYMPDHIYLSQSPNGVFSYFVILLFPILLFHPFLVGWAIEIWKHQVSLLNLQM